MPRDSAKPAGPPLTAAKIRDFEKKARRKLPAEYRALLLKQNGGAPERTLFDFRAPKGKDGSDVLAGFFGIGARVKTSDLTYALKTYADRVPGRMLPIARTAFGNLVCASCAGKDKGQIFFWDHEEEADEGEPPREDNLYRAAKSLKEFVANLYEPSVPDWEAACKMGDVARLRGWLDERRRSRKELGDAAELAAKHGQLDVLKLLVERGATAAGLLRLAAGNKHLNVVKHLLASQLKVEQGDLRSAAGGGDARIVKLLLEHGAKVDEGIVTRSRDGVRWTPLMAAAQAGSLPTVRLLLEHGADPLAVDDFGQRPSMRARAAAAWKVVSLLEKAERAAEKRPKRKR